MSAAQDPSGTDLLPWADLEAFPAPVPAPRDVADAAGARPDHDARAAAPPCLVTRFEWDRASARLEIDPRWLLDYRHTPESVAAELATEWRTLVYAPDVPALERALDAAFADPAGHLDVEARMVALDGTTRRFRLVAWIEGREGPQAARLVGLLENTTARHLAERDLQGQIAAIGKAQLVSEFDLEGRLLSANANFLAAFGYTLAELDGRHHSFLVDPAEASSTAYREFWDRLGRGEFAAGRFRRRDRDGREVWIQANYNPVFDDLGRPFKVVKYATDISDEQRRHADLEGQVRAIHHAQLTMEIGLDGRIRTANELALRVLGYSLHELWGRPHAMLVPEEDRNLPEYRDLWRRLARGEHAAGLFRRRGRRGRDVWLQVTCSPILDPNGQPWKFVEYATDVTDEVLRRADLQGQVDAIQRTQCTVEYDMAGRVISANDRFLALTGYRLEDIIGQPHRIFMLAGAAESADHARHWADLAAGQSASGEFRRRRKDGSTIWISGTYHPILDPRGKPVKIVQYCADATERVATQQALRDNELKLRGLFELSPAGIALLDEASGRILEANGALAALLGLPEELVVGRDFSDFLVGSAYATVLAGLHGGHAGERLESVEVSIRSPGGLPSAALLSGMRSIDPGGQRRVWAIVQDISQRKLAERELERAAMTDSLTGLANRPAFLRALEGAVARYRDDPTARYGVLLLDFDRFKFVNDTLGHAAGDQLLQHIGDRLRGRVRTGPRAGAGGRSGGIAARFGGDEFAVLVADLQADAEIEVITERLLKSLAEPYALLGRQIHSSASIGVFVASDPALTADEVMQQADLAMYEAKHRGRNRAARFDEGMQARLRRRLTLESDLRDAIEAGALTVAYQPIVDLQTGRIDGAEALVRWTHPTLGVISPAEFVPIAEDANLIVALGARVLQSACETFQHWRRTDPGRAPRRISVNMSRVELALGDAYIERLRSVLAETGMPAESLLLEVTEREIMRNPALSLELMKRLKAVGVRLAMDDFGTGASSLSCLRDYPFDIIKIDRSFLADLEAQQDVLMVLHATVTLVENLGMASVAEGIERPAQVAVLQTIGCRYGQGFLFSKAVPGDQFLAIDALHAWHDAAPAPTG